MNKKLILAEKPSLAKEIATALGITSKNKNGFFEKNDIIVAWLVGHVLKAEYEKVPWTKENLPLTGLKNHIMKPILDKKDLVRKLLSEINRKDVSEIVSAGDADQEGSLLVYELLEYAKVLNKKTITRMWILAVDEDTLREAYENRFSIEKDMKYVQAAKSRGFADVLVGFNFSRLFTMKSNMKASVGRVRTSVMQIVYHRILEIENFKPEKYFNIKGTFSNGVISLLEIETKDEEGHIKNSTRIPIDYFEKHIKSKLKKDDEYTVISVNSKIDSKLPDLLPNQNDILKSVSKIHKIDAKAVEVAMQFLYENKFISYPRSEKRHLRVSTFPNAEVMFKHLTKLYSDNIGNSEISLNIDNKRIFDDTKVEEHFAVIPWKPKSQSEIDKLDSAQKYTYDYIVAKFLMACMKPNKFASSAIVLENEDKTLHFKATGKIEKEKGYKSYKYPTNKSSKDITLPDVKKGDKTSLIDFKNDIKTTTPPPLLTKPDILDIMENITKLYKKISEEDEETYDGKFSLGTSATRIGILEELFKKYKYLQFNNKKQVILSEEAIKLLNIIGDKINVKLTASFEADMGKIYKDISYSDIFEQKMQKYVNQVVNDLLPTFEYSPPKKHKTDLVCPLCSNGNLIETSTSFRCEKAGKWDSKKKKWSGCQFGIFINQKPLNRNINIEEVKKLLDGGTLTSPNGGSVTLDLKSKFFTKTTWDNSGVSESGNSSSDVILETPKFYKKGNDIIWKSISGKNINKDIAEKLFNGETVSLKGFTSKKGKKFDANIKLENGKVNFSF